MVEYRQVQIISGRSLLEDNCLVKSVFFGVGCFNMYGKHRKLLSFWPEYAEVIGKRTIEIQWKFWPIQPQIQAIFKTQVLAET